MFLKVNNLKKYYSQDEHLIRDLNFSVKEGDIVSFIGESGSGKTTFEMFSWFRKNQFWFNRAKWKSFRQSKYFCNSK